MLALIKRIEKIVKLDIRYFGVNSLYLIMANCVFVLMGFFLVYIFTHFASKDVFGTYKYLFSILGLLVIFSLPGMNMAITQAVSRNLDQVFIKGIKTRIKYSLLGICALIIVAFYFYFQDRIQIANALLISAILFLPFYALNSHLAFLYGKKLFNIVFKYKVILTILGTSGTAIAVILFPNNLVMIVMAHMLIISLINGFFIFNILRKVKITDSFDKHSISYGKHLTLVGILPVIQSHIDSILIGSFISFSSLAIYSVAKIFSQPIKMLWEIIYQLIFPKLSEKDSENALISVKTRFKYLMLFFGIICLTLIFFLPIVVPILFTRQYSTSIFYAQLIIAGAFLAIPGSLFETYLISQKMEKKIYFIRISIPILNILLLLIFIWRFGLIGVIIAKIGSNFLYSILSWRLARMEV